MWFFSQKLRLKVFGLNKNSLRLGAIFSMYVGSRSIGAICLRMRVFWCSMCKMADFEGIIMFWISTRYISVSFIPISHLLYGNNGGMS